MKEKLWSKCNTEEANKKKVHIGINHPLYKRDRSQIKSKRPRYENTQWRKAVFERDNYTCVFCNIKGGKLQADHIKPYCLYPDLRWELDNGRTLCFECHKKTDTYGINSTKYKQDGPIQVKSTSSTNVRNASKDC
jgi:5-methylcytosine-specific restriction endonuclease McrA